jgi:hypothetical protein
MSYAESFADDLHERLVATSARFSQVALELTEGLLYVGLKSGE